MKKMVNGVELIEGNWYYLEHQASEYAYYFKFKLVEDDRIKFHECYDVQFCNWDVETDDSWFCINDVYSEFKEVAKDELEAFISKVKANRKSLKPITVKVVE